MPFTCLFCSKPYTTCGTDHALYSTICGHLVGKSCIEAWKNEEIVNGQFKCPMCCQYIKENDYHPIYGLPEEFFKIKLLDYKEKCQNDKDVALHYALGNLENESLLMEKVVQDDIYSTFDLFDVHNGYLLNVGYSLENFNYNQTLQIYDLSSGCECFFKSLDGLEFCLCFDNGLIENILYIYGMNDVIRSVSFEGYKEIISICFVSKERFVYSVIEHGIYVSSTEFLDSKKHWSKQIDEKSEISHLQKDQTPYILYCDNEKYVINYTYNSAINMILIVYTIKGGVEDDCNTFAAQVVYGISKCFNYKSNGSKSEKYITYPLNNIKNHYCQMEYNFKPALISITDDNKMIISSFKMGVEEDTLEISFLNDDFKYVTVKKIENLRNCIAIYSIKRPVIFFTKTLKIPIILIFKEKYVIYDFFCSLEYEKE
ncbi:Zinc finger, RING-type domain and Zinc finger, RING/FYVE/PHD-type domain-containing protein [Strongyloides ratti]|uniref:Zinc finger, RING-type domain and Zinc finger, RING/FYVE/PHD-type domain-containing protein n=1 Tax=Strongyloides ratti TaxID=34506 RepID=A0A090KWZ2_STRRB|nr:Zinc finger, RING-type domain and Zinc finger, RING/FYVE/PHD-type domain-containing protein [Strongyloides ratti]CEF62025.1 Zinc finger, RING-type domain and Zinc finger, RING/FYVE/PHD-type domain-containing protein [Strongyloides ratti]